jgi:hypothetical protein
MQIPEIYLTYFKENAESWTQIFKPKQSKDQQ